MKKIVAVLGIGFFLASCGDTPQEGVGNYESDTAAGQLPDTSGIPPVNYQQDSSSTGDTTVLQSGKHGARLGKDSIQ